MTNFSKYGLALLLAVSLAVNGIFYMNLKEANHKIEDIDTMISTQVEKGLRQTIAYMTELTENQSPQTMQNLQRTAQDLAVAFRHWLNLNQTERASLLSLEKGVNAVESLRNGIVHHLNNQYLIHDNQLNEYDIEFLEQAQESLTSYLLLYENSKGSLDQLKKANQGEERLIQVAERLEEVTRLYRHSLTPNRHPAYISYEEAVQAVMTAYPQLRDYELSEQGQAPLIREGVHYYSFNYYHDDVLVYTLGVDAIDGSVRNFELKLLSQGKAAVLEDEAIKIAREHLSNVYNGDLKEEMAIIQTEANENEVVYAFRFTPVVQEVSMVSDAYTINIASDGSIIRYNNDFKESELPSLENHVTVEEVLEANQEQYPNLTYDGVSVIRVFLTNFQPKAVYGFKTVQNEQQLLIFFDMMTGKQLHQLYYIYEAIE